MSTDRELGKEDVVCVYNGILLSHKKNEIMPFVATWMDLEIIILSEVSQKDKDKYHMISHIVVVFQLLSHVQLFVIPWTAPCQASLSFIIS